MDDIPKSAANYPPGHPTQADIDAEILDIATNRPTSSDPNWGAHRTLVDYPPYRSSILRHPSANLELVDPETIELHSPAFGQRDVHWTEYDLTKQVNDEPQGERIVVTGKVTDADGRPARHQLVEIWQANAGGRYRQKKERHPAPLDPNFNGVGRVLTNADGEYKFVTIKPGAYPWPNHVNAWRPAHIHFSVFGSQFAERMVTQMYFPGDPLLAFDPMYNCIANEGARQRLIAAFDWENTIPEQALGYRFDIVLRGREETPMEKMP
jgi:protocatechuate 3,4-dioxygenase beta subunit